MGILYFIQPAELVGTNRFKVGCSTKNDLSRVKSYKAGTRMIMILQCEDPFLLEQKVLVEFKNQFHKIAGNEYFEGDESVMRKVFYDTYLLWEHQRDAVEALEEAKWDAEIERVTALRDAVREKRRALRAGELDAELTAGIVARSAEGCQPKTKTKVPRPPLVGLIKSRTFFRYKFKGVEYGCYSDTGEVFHDGGSTDTYKSLAEFCAEKIKASGDTTGTMVSVYEKVYAKLNHCQSGDPWRKWGVLYHEGTVSIN